MFTDSEKELNIVSDNLSNFATAIVEFIAKVINFFQDILGIELGIEVKPEKEA